ncbi:hypothetical protein ACSLMH_01720 [Flavobacterium columnare]|jgi:hypothetical protein|uniref:hypothetical protein n=1 Tax=Flavobacterium columnare TaxID=996 RepID=UPI0040335D7A
MNTNFISNIIIGLLALNIIVQLIISIKYNWKFVLEYLNNEKSSWNPNIDRIKLAASISFTLFSIILSKSIIKKDTSVFEIIIIIFSITLLSGLIYFVLNKTDRNNTKIEEVEKLVFKTLDEKTHKELRDKLITENRAIINDSDLLTLSKGINLENKIKWIDKIGRKSTNKSRSKNITYGFIFDIFNDYYIQDGIKNLKTIQRNELLNFIIENFTKENEHIKYENINKSYSEWKKLAG